MARDNQVHLGILQEILDSREQDFLDTQEFVHRQLTIVLHRLFPQFPIDEVSEECENQSLNLAVDTEDVQQLDGVGKELLSPRFSRLRVELVQPVDIVWVDRFSPVPVTSYQHRRCFQRATTLRLDVIRVGVADNLNGINLGLECLVQFENFPIFCIGILEPFIQRPNLHIPFNFLFGCE